MQATKTRKPKASKKSKPESFTMPIEQPEYLHTVENPPIRHLTFAERHAGYVPVVAKSELVANRKPELSIASLGCKYFGCKKEDTDTFRTIKQLTVQPQILAKMKKQANVKTGFYNHFNMLVATGKIKMNEQGYYLA